MLLNCEKRNGFKTFTYEGLSCDQHAIYANT